MKSLMKEEKGDIQQLREQVAVFGLLRLTLNIILVSGSELRAVDANLIAELGVLFMISASRGNIGIFISHTVCQPAVFSTENAVP